MITINQFADFKRKYDEYLKTHQNLLQNLFKKDFELLRKSYETYQNLVDESNLQLARDFNVFKILGLESREVTTHTRFFAELLNPKGTHGQNNLFLHKFLKTTIQCDDNIALDSEWKVITEIQNIDLRIVLHPFCQARFKLES